MLTIKELNMREYDRHRAVVFRKTTAPFGGLSNMARGFPVEVNGQQIRTAEALYQACRFPLNPEIQTVILAEASPMAAKMRSKPYRHLTRPDWDDRRLDLMWWSLNVKLLQNWATFSQLLESTGELPIVEEKSRADFWGAKAIGETSLIGVNALGRLLEKLRSAVRSGGITEATVVMPLPLPDFRLLGREIEPVAAPGRRAPGLFD